MALPKIKKQIEARVKDTGDSMSGGLEIKNTGPMFTMTNSTSGQDMRLYPASNSTILLNRNVAGDSTNYRALYLHNSTASSSINSALVLQDTVNGTANNYNLLHAGNYNNYAPTKGGTGATGTWGISISGSSDYANYIIKQDTRDINEAPVDMLTGLSIHLKGTADGLNDGGIYHAAIHIKDWQDYSGGPFGQMAITENSNFWFRVSTSGTAWGAWKKILDSSNYTSYTVTKTGSGASGTWPISISGNAATASSISWNNISEKPNLDRAPIVYSIDLSNYSTSNFYFIDFGVSNLELDCEIHSRGASAADAWNQNVLHFLLTASGWSDTPQRLFILNQSFYTGTEKTIMSIVHGNQGGLRGVYLRGGLTYTIRSNFKPTVNTSTRTNGNESFASGTSSYTTITNATTLWTNDGNNQVRIVGNLNVTGNYLMENISGGIAAMQSGSPNTKMLWAY